MKGDSVLFDIINKLASRKLLVTILTMLTALFSGQLMPTSDGSMTATLAAVIAGSIYVIMQGLVDRKTAVVKATTSDEFQQALKRIEQLSKQFSSNSTGVATTAETTSSIKSALPVLLALLTIPALVACGGTEKPLCAPATLAAIQAKYAAELFESCQGKTLDTCDTDAIDNKYTALTQEWVECQ